MMKAANAQWPGKLTFWSETSGSVFLQNALQTVRGAESRDAHREERPVKRLGEESHQACRSKEVGKNWQKVSNSLGSAEDGKVEKREENFNV